MAWAILILAGIFEIFWAIGLKYTEGFTKVVPSALTLVGMLISFWLLSVAMRTLPLGLSYAVWTGIGTLGTVVFGIVWLGESTSILKLVCIGLILAGLIGLKISH